MKNNKKHDLPTAVSMGKFNLMCDGDNFVLRSDGKRLAKMSHAEWDHLADAVKNRTTVTLDKYSLQQKGDSYSILDNSGKEIVTLSAGEIDQLIRDADAYLKKVSKVEESSILKIAEMISDSGKVYKNFDEWKKAVLAHHSKVASKLKMKGRMERGVATISAEIPGQDRSYGVWHSDKEEGVVLGESKTTVSELFQNADPGEYDQEGDMAQTQLRTIIDAAQELHDMLSADDNLPEWVQSKLTLAQDYVTTVRDYLKARHEGM